MSGDFKLLSYDSNVMTALPIMGIKFSVAWKQLAYHHVRIAITLVNKVMSNVLYTIVLKILNARQ